MSGLFGSSTQANQQTVASGVTIQSSVNGRAIPVIYGTTVVAPNLIAYGNFRVVAQSDPSSSGKGGIFGSGGTTNYYYAALAFALCQGPIAGVGSVVANKDLTSLARLGFSLFTGTYPQSPWGTAVDNAPVALGYNGIAYIASASYSLGTTPNLPNHKVEVKGIYSNSVSGQIDADPSLVFADILTNTHYGAGYPSARLGSLANYQNYTLAAGLLISVAYVEQRAVGEILDELVQLTNSEMVFSSGLLSVVPRGDTALTGNGKTYTPPGAAVFDLTDDDFLVNQSSGSSGGDPVAMLRKRASDATNSVKLEYLSRTVWRLALGRVVLLSVNMYAPDIAPAKDQALIDQFRERQSGSQPAHLFALGTAANLSAQLILQRQVAVRNSYGFTLDARFFVLDPMDIVTLTDSALGLDRQAVRILEISENADGSYSFIAEDYTAGVGSSATYSFSQGEGPAADFNTDPGVVNEPVIFEPPDALGQGLKVWMALSGADTALWGGAQVWVSTDGGTVYRNMGTVAGPAREGTLTAPLPTAITFLNPPSIDQAGTLSVDVSASGAQLNAASQQDALALSTACYVGAPGEAGEYLAYAGAALTGTGKYDLTYLVRGAYGSTIAAHAAGSQFARLDRGIFALPFTADLIGKTLSIKFVSFNVYGGGLQTLADVGAYSYTITGSALSSALPNVSNLRAVFEAGVMKVWWDEIDDFRPVQYEIRKGVTYPSSLLVQIQAHPPFVAFGDDTYWVTAISTPTAGLTVYSVAPQSIAIAGSLISQNVVISRDEAANGWRGTFDDGVGKETGASSIRTGGGGNILTDPAVLMSAATNAATAAGDDTLHFASAVQTNDSYCKVLLHMNGSDASTTFTDDNAGGTAHTWTANGDAQIDTAAYKFGGAAGLFDGTGDYISTPDSADFHLGSGDFTIDLWFNCSVAAGVSGRLIGQADATLTAASRTFNMQKTVADVIAGAVIIGGVVTVVTGTTVFTNVTNTGWHHAALVRSGNTLTLYIDGVSEATTALTGTVQTSANNLSVGIVGEQVSSAWNGWIDEVRLSVGIARWTANFAPPTSAYIAPVVVGLAITDSTTPSAIPANTTVKAVTSTTVQMDKAAAGAGVGNGDTIVFATPDIINYGGEMVTAGYYTIATADRINVGYVAQALVGASWVGTGSPVGQNILSIADFLGTPDILGSANSTYVDVHPEVRFAQADGIYGPWQKLVPGVYVAQYFDFRMFLKTIDAATIAYCLAWLYSVRVTARIDHYLNQAVPSGGAGLAISFTPDTPAGGTPQVASPFNGGPNSDNLPAVSVAWQNANGDTLVLSGLSLSGVTVHIQNAGVDVARTANITVEGY